MAIGCVVHRLLLDLLRHRLAGVGLHVWGGVDGVLGGMAGVYVLWVWLVWVCLSVCGRACNWGYVVAVDGLLLGW